MKSHKIQIRSEREFQTLMESLDQEMRAEGIPLEARPMNGWSRVPQRIGAPLRFPVPDRAPHDGCYEGDELTIRIFRWFAHIQPPTPIRSFQVGFVAGN